MVMYTVAISSFRKEYASKRHSYLIVNFSGACISKRELCGNNIALDMVVLSSP